MSSVYFLLLGLALGFFLGWLWRSWRPPPTDDRLENELREQLRAREGELQRARDLANASGQARATAEASAAAAQNILAEEREAKKRLELDLQSGREQLVALKKTNGELEERARFLDERLKIERQQVEAVQEKFRQEFEAISNKLLLHSSTRFNEQSTQSLETLLGPWKEKMSEFKASLEDTRKETATHSALLKEQITRISAEAAHLAKALKGDAKALGNWGENMLDQILEKSGLQAGLHYRRQHGAQDAAGDQRFLDVIIELPDQRHLIVDSKMSLRRYEEAVNQTDETSRLALLDQHVEAVRKHFTDLGRKRYQEIHGLNAPDFVLMYVPLEAAFFAALAREPGLFSEALDHNVVLITNSTLLATLRTVAHVWRLAGQQQHALEIADRGGKLYDKFVGFISDLETVGAALKDGQEAWERATNKLHTGGGNLVRQAEQLRELGVKAAKALPADLVQKATAGEVKAELAPPPTA